MTKLWINSTDFRLAVLSGLMAGGVIALSGCNWSPPTLAVEMPRSDMTDAVVSSEPAEVASHRVVEAPVSTSPVTIPPAAAEPGVSPPSSEGDVAAVTGEATGQEQSPTRLLPKLANVSASQLIGRWRDSFFGTRTLTLNADGTAKMELDLDFAGRLLYGKRLEFDMKWSLESGVVSIDIVEGRPAAASKLAMGTWGSRYEYLLDRVEPELVEMRSGDGSMNHTLRRLADE